MLKGCCFFIALMCLLGVNRFLIKHKVRFADVVLYHAQANSRLTQVAPMNLFVQKHAALQSKVWAESGDPLSTERFCVARFYIDARQSDECGWR